MVIKLQLIKTGVIVAMTLSKGNIWNHTISMQAMLGTMYRIVLDAAIIIKWNT